MKALILTALIAGLIVAGFASAARGSSPAVNCGTIVCDGGGGSAWCTQGWEGRIIHMNGWTWRCTQGRDLPWRPWSWLNGYGYFVNYPTVLDCPCFYYKAVA